MPLRDHFHGWLDKELQWHSFHHAWVTTLAYALNANLPERFRASPNVQTSIEIDVATYGNVEGAKNSSSANGNEFEQ